VAEAGDGDGDGDDDDDLLQRGKISNAKQEKENFVLSGNSERSVRANGFRYLQIRPLAFWNLYVVIIMRDNCGLVSQCMHLQENVLHNAHPLYSMRLRFVIQHGHGGRLDMLQYFR
jgi:hypothetical protein